MRDAQADEQLPCMHRIYDVIEEDWATLLDDACVGGASIQTGEYDEKDLDEMLADLRHVAREVEVPHLTMREYDDRGRYATSTIKEHFGSWSDACDAAGIESGTRHGEQCRGPNGERLDSRHELAVAQWLTSHTIEYTVHPPVENTDWIADFHLPTFDLWIEVDGYTEGERPNEASFSDKLSDYEANDLDYLVVHGTAELEEKLLGDGTLSD